MSPLSSTDGSSKPFTHPGSAHAGELLFDKNGQIYDPRFIVDTFYHLYSIFHQTRLG